MLREPRGIVEGAGVKAEDLSEVNHDFNPNSTLVKRKSPASLHWFFFFLHSDIDAGWGGASDTVCRA